MGLFRRKEPNNIVDAGDAEKVPSNDSLNDDLTAAKESQRPRRGLRRFLGIGRKRRNNDVPDDDFVDDVDDDDDDEGTEEADDVVDVLVGPPPTMAPKGTFQPSHLQSRITEVSNESMSMFASPNNSMLPEPQRRAAAVPPPAREAAFHGPPLFDWIDIEYTAATKIQAIQRRNKVMNDLESRGLSTSAIRNRKRRRKAANRSYFSKLSQPSLFNCCAIGLAFGDGTDDDDAYREFQRKKYEERVQQQQAHEDALRRRYLKGRNMKEATAILETVEVVD